MRQKSLSVRSSSRASQRKKKRVAEAHSNYLIKRMTRDFQIRLKKMTALRDKLITLKKKTGLKKEKKTKDRLLSRQLNSTRWQVLDLRLESRAKMMKINS